MSIYGLAPPFYFIDLGQQGNRVVISPLEQIFLGGHKVQCLKIITQEISPKFSNFAKSHLGKGSTWQAQHMSMDNGYNITDFVNKAKNKMSPKNHF